MWCGIDISNNNYSMNIRQEEKDWDSAKAKDMCRSQFIKQSCYSLLIYNSFLGQISIIQWPENKHFLRMLMKIGTNLVEKQPYTYTNNSSSFFQKDMTLFCHSMAFLCVVVPGLKSAVCRNSQSSFSWKIIREPDFLLFPFICKEWLFSHRLLLRSFFQLK